MSEALSTKTSKRNTPYKPKPLSKKKFKELASECVSRGLITLGFHCQEKMIELGFDLQDVQHILKRRYTYFKYEWENTHSKWKYYIRGKDLDNLELEIVVNLNKSLEMFVITGYYN